ncbi:MAG: methylenetetrahydrofolate--tRNA-(uracil(54)-C(5))-methyltransferase (FADH(2)-oxidizing) TrmFO [Candidatus Lambdaproteobacteria bacterium]|nr:methylenetetrahydrofolate--tRNA-(uracil(54)-C(5))-methyltransferase (FADH(2)-oxidizing) TrmFO [Candidatus Lambdaproteobacteria bacterium]
MAQNAAIAIVGAGFAGSEAAWQLARRGHAVHLYEMRPGASTEAHRSAYCAELVCSNSFKSRNLHNAHGLLKGEMARQGSLLTAGAYASAVPAGQALAVDRDRFARWITARLEAEPLIVLRREPVHDVETLLAAYRRVLICTGPLTAAPLAASIEAFLGTSHLAFYDAIAPVVLADSVDRDIVFRASRYGKGDDDYLNCPLDKAQYRAFVEAVRTAQTVPLHAFEELRPFEGCLPIEVMAARGPRTLAFGPMKPVGLDDPRTGRWPYAVVQLRQENAQGTLYGLVGFQTKMTWPEQRRVLRMIPGLAQAEFARLGSMHRNTFIQSPRVLNTDLACRAEPRLSFAGQLAGVEGYMESGAMGLYAAKRIAGHESGRVLPALSPATMTGALVRYLTSTPADIFQPMNANFGLLEPAPTHVGKAERKAFQAQRALEEIDALERLEFHPDRSGHAHETPQEPAPDPVPGAAG